MRETYKKDSNMSCQLFASVGRGGGELVKVYTRGGVKVKELESNNQLQGLQTLCQIKGY